jgi:DNA polymerase-3 subunit delta'
MSLAGVIGNRVVIESLWRELARRPSHAYLFTGPSGIGKALVAKGVAHYSLCERSPGPDFCCTVENCPVRAAPRTVRGRTAQAAPRCDCCAGCIQLAAGVHPDFAYVARAPNRSDVLIEQVRALIDSLGAKPVRGERRVAIIDDAETLNLPAQNALLKTLEEPPGHALIILVSSNERALLDTVRSRTRLVRFHPIATPELATFLKARADLSTEQAGSLARLARGSTGRALELNGGVELPVRELLDALGRADSLDFAAIQKLAQQFFGAREQAVNNFELIARLLEEMLCFKLLQTSFAVSGESAKLMTRLSNRLEAPAIATLAQDALAAHAAVEAMANSRLQAENWWMAASAAMRGE